MSEKQWSYFKGWNKFNGLILGSKTQLNTTDFPALDKLKCPGVTQNPQRAKSFNTTKQIVKHNAKSPDMIMYGHSNI